MKQLKPSVLKATDTLSEYWVSYFRHTLQLLGQLRHAEETFFLESPVGEPSLGVVYLIAGISYRLDVVLDVRSRVVFYWAEMDTKGNLKPATEIPFGIRLLWGRNCLQMARLLDSRI